jgi:acetyltransferase-like isoleucine patch superfamily enzyme
VARARLARLGCRLEVRAAATPRLFGLPLLEIEPTGRGALLLVLGRDVKLGRDLTLDVRTGDGGAVVLGDRVTFQNRVRLQPWGGTIRLADDVQVRDGCELKSKGVLELGPRTILGRNVTLHAHERITFGADVGLAERVTVADSDHRNDGGTRTHFMKLPVVSDPVELGDNVFLGTNAVVLRGTRIGPGAVAAAGAVVRGEQPAGMLLAGAPAVAKKPVGG